MIASVGHLVRPLPVGSLRRLGRHPIRTAGPLGRRLAETYAGSYRLSAAVAPVRDFRRSRLAIEVVSSTGGAPDDGGAVVAVESLEEIIQFFECIEQRRWRRKSDFGD